MPASPERHRRYGQRTAFLRQRIGAAKLTIGSVRRNKGLPQLNQRGQEKVNIQRHLHRMAHNIEKLAYSGWSQSRG